MDSTFQALRIQDLESRLGLRELVRTTLASEFETSTSTQERAELAFRWDEVLKECFVLRLVLDLLKRKQA